jgi:hypothetical protein
MSVRFVREEELDELIEWGMPLFKHRFPRCTKATILPLLRSAVHGNPKLHFVRTENAAGLFVAVDPTPWEPMWVVNEVVVGSRQVAPFEVKRIYHAGRVWAEEIGACEYNFGASTGIDLMPMARRIGYDRMWQGFTVDLVHEPMVA